MFLATAAPGRESSTYSKRETIFAQGDDADSVFYIKKGKVKVAVLSKQGKEAVPLNGRSSVHSGQTRLASLTCLRSVYLKTFGCARTRRGRIHNLRQIKVTGETPE